VRGEILEWEHVAGREGHNGVRVTGGGEFAEALKYRNEIFDGAVVVDYKDEGTVGGAAQEYQEQGFCRGGESRYTNAPRALLKVGGYTREGGKHFYVREEFTDEGKKHQDDFSRSGVGGSERRSALSSEGYAGDEGSGDFSSTVKCFVT
jgi:hypothetical protein